MNKTKTCTKCKRELPLDSDHFNHKCDTKDGFTSRCKECSGGSFTNHLNKPKPREGFHFCNKCNRELPFTKQYFPVDSGAKFGLRKICRECNPNYGKFLPDDYVHPDFWSEEDKNLLVNVYSDYTGAELVEKFFPNRTARSLESQASLLGITGKSEETRQRAIEHQSEIVRQKLTGRTLSEEQKQAISIRNKEYYKTHPNPRLGYKYTEEESKALGKRTSDRGLWKGDLNPRHINPLTGDKNGRWKGGITLLYFELRSDTKQWQQDSMKFCKYKCVVTGENFDEVHHIKPFREIVDQTFKNLQFDCRPTVSDYSKDEFEQIRTEMLQIHKEFGYGACLSKEVHKLFHDTYGYTQTNKDDFIDFIEKFSVGFYDHWLTENGMTKKINYTYFDYIKNI